MVIYRCQINNPRIYPYNYVLRFTQDNFLNSREEIFLSTTSKSPIAWHSSKLSSPIRQSCGLWMRHMHLLRLFLTGLPLIQPLYARSLHPREISHQEIQLITQGVGQRCIKRRRAGTHVL